MNELSLVLHANAIFLLIMNGIHERNYLKKKFFFAK